MLRLGVRRPARPSEVVAIAEARVLQHELERRLGPVALDLRLDGDPIGPWMPEANASWPVAIDAEIDGGRLWADGLPPLTTLFGRTVEPLAAEVRRRMLAHLGMLPATFDQAALDELSRLPIRPTDLWLMVNRAERVDVDDPAVAALAADGAALDVVFDEVVAALEGVSPSERQLLRLRAAADVHARRSVELADELARSETEAADRLDELARENEVLRERLARAELDRDRS